MPWPCGTIHQRDASRPIGENFGEWHALLMRLAIRLVDFSAGWSDGFLHIIHRLKN